VAAVREDRGYLGTLRASALVTTDRERGGPILSQKPASPVKDKNYDLITVLHRCLKATWRLETYKEDARREGDAELADWFEKLQGKSREAGEEGKRLLADRLQREGG
jgi:hypothetical protein